MAEFENDDLTFVTRHHNRVLRKVNKSLRNAHQLAQEYSDALFMELCNAGTEAELAMEELWTLGKFECDPRNYEFIVEMCLRALEDSETLSHRPEAAMQKTLERQRTSE